MVYGIVAVVLGYLLGSIPTAYIVTRLVRGKDVRQLGGGNVGGLNVYREVGFLPAAVVAIVDLGKGAAAVAIAYWLLDLSLAFVLAVALAAVVGHNWMLFLKFSGGKGMGPAIGGLFVLLPIYGYPLGLAFFFAVVFILFIITRNVALSMGVGLLSLPFIAWLGMNSIPEQTEFIIYSVALGLIILAKFTPTAIAAVARTRSVKGFVFDRGRKGKKQ
ncbi:MAG: glycerol-3-phosphate acyltransferase [Deltaproteobacteria bacterium]|nr:glycerol-3-phosphate acyltransferase [Deltaproteobacteria bacterium]